MEILQVRSRQRNEWIDISSSVQRIVEEQGLRDGFCILFVPHTTAAITVNEGADPSVKEDVLRVLAGIVPRDGAYRHSEGNSDAHAKSSLIGPSVLIPVVEGRLALGTWQAVFFCEFDGPRNRKVQVHLTQRLPPTPRKRDAEPEKTHR